MQNPEVMRYGFLSRYRQNSRPPSSPDLYDLSRPRLVAAQCWPAAPVDFDQRELYLRAHDAPTRFFWVDGGKEWNGLDIPLAVCGGEVEVEDKRGLEGDFGGGLVDLFEVERGDNGGGGLVEIVPGNKKVSILRNRALGGEHMNGW